MHSNFLATPRYIISIFTSGIHDSHTPCCAHIVSLSLKSSFRAYVMTPWGPYSANINQLSIGWVGSKGTPNDIWGALDWYLICQLVKITVEMWLRINGEGRQEEAFAWIWSPTSRVPRSYTILKVQ
jgi:hypothetical protein